MCRDRHPGSVAEVGDPTTFDACVPTFDMATQAGGPVLRASHRGCLTSKEVRRLVAMEVRLASHARSWRAPGGRPADRRTTIRGAPAPQGEHWQGQVSALREKPVADIAKDLGISERLPALHVSRPAGEEVVAAAVVEVQVGELRFSAIRRRREPRGLGRARRLRGGSSGRPPWLAAWAGSSVREA